MKRAIVALIGLAIGCGGKVDGTPDGGDGGTTDGSFDAGLDAAGWTNCEAPSGVSICGGPNDCGSQCKTCVYGDSGLLNACNDVNYQFTVSDGAADTFLCPDGAMNACAFDKGAPDCWQGACVTEDLPKLYLLNGRPDLARYSDRASYTGDPIPPPPTSCPSVAQGLELCGGACGPCQDGTMTCTGRSPLHPYSMCLTSEPESFPCARGSNGYCNSVRPGDMCLTYKVDSAAQSIADQNSLCVPASICQAAAQSYPGGAFCTAGS